MVTDPISNLIIGIKNAARAGKPTVRVPFSRLKEAIADVLVREGFLEAVEKKGKKHKNLELTLAFQDEKAVVSDVKRVSKPSKRVYTNVREIVPIRHGHGRVVLSTPQGIMTGEEARKAKVGGEVLFEIW